MNERKEYNTYIIFQEDLLYRLASHKLLHKLCGATRSKHVEGAYVWFFEKDPEVFKVIKEYNAEKRAEHNTDAGHSN